MCFFIFNVFGSEKNEYLEPYKRICADSEFYNKAIIVSSYLIDFDRFNFLNSKDFTEEDKQKIINHREQKNFIWDAPIYEPKLIFLQGKSIEQPEYIIYFSPIEDEMLVACVAKYNNSELYENNVSFCEVTEFLFILDLNGQILKQSKIRVIVD